MSAGKIIGVLLLIIFLMLALFAPRSINDLANFIRDVSNGHGFH